MELVIRESKLGRFVLLAVDGELDAATAPQLRDRLRALTDERGTNVVVDLQAVGFLDSSALSVLVSGRKAALANDGTLRLVCSNPNVLKVFQLTQLDEVFDINPSVEAATS